MAQKKFDAAIEALLTCGTVSEAAEKAKIGRRTLVRWLHEDAGFQQRLVEARQELLRHGTARLCALLSRAVTVISDALDGADISKSKFLAAKLTVETCRAIEQDDIVERVEQLEQEMRDRQNSRDRELDGLTVEQLEQRLRVLRADCLTDFNRDELSQRLRQMGGNGGNGDEAI